MHKQDCHLFKIVEDCKGMQEFKGMILEYKNSI